jgi:hypothetical protein
VVHRSARAQALTLKGRTYGVDIVVEVGYLRYHEHRSIPEIRDRLVERKVEVSEREVYELLHVFEELVAARPPAVVIALVHVHRVREVRELEGVHVHRQQLRAEEAAAVAAAVG